ncbi:MULTISPECIES: leucine--tRNA ligase [Halolamina]|uniref:Leucine--tRNA ligase n=1 Tax=Halolamina pelagica TaxID=699431 RepID=A0A1I5SEZ6_9EURY|nr:MULTISPECIES: leucine--tRNA ligase [Halolamina]NHX37090.1 leucine--tRNA ligase [Halolamina sp. R1-12]SFP69299.1 leucyl-tRNA synthetase [Halolamina pelagica]
MDYDPQAIEERWRQRWREEGRYEADPAEGADGDDATFVTVPYPYPSGGMHIGHARTYTVPDAYARYRRQQGDNVLFPMAWHVTGTPIIGAVERLKKGEEEQLSVLQDTYNVPEEDLSDLETPMGFAEYFIEEHYKKGMKSLGLSVDWRREFTTNDERYSTFIEWQYETLKEKGLVEKGLHPVNYCTEEEQPVTTHDLLEGEEAEFQEYTLIRFRGDSPDDGEAVFPMATLRPETVRGVTNAYVDPEATYVRASVDGETWVVSADAAEKFDLQDREVEIETEFTGADVVGTTVENPVTGDDVQILPAGFVDADNATGVVMSVPAHSPDDYVALQELKDRADELTEYGVDPETVREIEPIPILSVEGYGEIPARDAVDARGIESSADPELEEATNDLYNAEFHSGILNDEYGEFAGEVVEDVRDRFREHHAGDAFDTMQEFSEEVVCRCGGDVEVAYQETWFLRYNDEQWQQRTLEAIENLDAIPENTRGEYEHTVDWLNEWPCIRNYGLGTRLPWDEDFVIEPLSDSTLYMSYYTVAPHIQDVPVEDLDHEFFDAMFYGEDAVDDPDPTALELGEEWDYWYPVDYRFSGNDLITNHLTFYLYHHAEFFPEPKWPQGIVVMGMGLLEGQKMSSSKGHVVLPGEAISEYGADTVRFFLLNASEPWQDYDWREDAVESTHDQLRRFYNRGRELIEGPEGDRDAVTDVDRWLLSKLQTTIETATDAMERSETRTATQAAFYGFDEHLKWYRRRADLDRPGARWTLRHVLETRLRLLAPFTPFMANELHEALTGTPAEDAPWPEVDDDLRAPDLELGEERVQALVDDINEVADVTDTDPEIIRIYAAADWKHQVFDAVREAGADVGAVMSEVMSDPDLRERGDEVNEVAQDAVEFARDYDDEELADLLAMDERAAYENAAPFLAREFDAEVEVYAEDDADVVDPADRAGNAIPFRPAIHLE